MRIRPGFPLLLLPFLPSPSISTFLLSHMHTDEALAHFPLLSFALKIFPPPPCDGRWRHLTPPPSSSPPIQTHSLLQYTHQEKWSAASSPPQKKSEKKENLEGRSEQNLSAPGFPLRMSGDQLSLVRCSVLIVSKLSRDRMTFAPVTHSGKSYSYRKKRGSESSPSGLYYKSSYRVVRED